MASVAQEIGMDLRDLNQPGNQLSQVVDLPPLTSASWNALGQFFSRPWFRRVWVIQEVAVGKQASTYCGDHEIDFVAIEFAAAWISRNNILGQTGEEGFRWTDNVLLMFRFADPRAMTILLPNPLPLLWLLKDFDATDVRDKVFVALLLMFNSDVNRPLPRILLPDFTKSTEAVYRDLVRYTF